VTRAATFVSTCALLLLFAGNESAVAQSAPPSASPPAAGDAGAGDPGANGAPPKTDDDTAKRLKVYDEIRVNERADDMVGVADSASQGVTGREDLQERPILRPGELLETVPGVIITQHAGGGKANQYFLRGFNLDHGTDFGISVDDVPVNMPSHGHGQGYSDLNFMIPELVENVRYEKGPYDATVGDFSAAGSAAMALVDDLPHGLLQLTPGDFGYRRAVVADSTPVGQGTLLGGLELAHNDGPWKRPDDYRKGNALLRYHAGDATAGYTLTAMGYDGRWDSSDQIPERAVAEGLIDRLGTLDDTTGGSSSRASLSLEAHRGNGTRLSSLSAYLVHYRLDLFSNFTYFLDDPVHGDQFEQSDRRTIGGFRLERQRSFDLGGQAFEGLLGLQGRYDDIHNGLFHTQARVVLSTTREDHIEQLSAAPYAQVRAALAPWLRAVVGLRYDSYRFRVVSDQPLNSGAENRGIVSPKLSLAFGPWAHTELYLNAGDGFHSNDARGTTIRVDPRTGALVQRVSPLVRATGYDVGARTSLGDRVQLAVTAFNLDLASELVFSGDAGNTEAGRPSRRRGIEVQSFYRVAPWLQVDADFAHSRSRFRDFDPVGDHIPGSIEDALALGVTVPDWRHAYASARLRYFGPRPLIEDDSVRSHASSLVYLDAGYRFESGLKLGVEVFNLLDAKVSDIDYYYPSRLPGEPAEGVSDVHFHPAEPRSVRLVAGWSF
jgi:hypothetical protein